MLTVIAVSDRLSPVFIVTEALSVIAASKVPAVLAVQYDVAVTTSPLVPAHDVHDGSVPFAETLELDGLAHVTALRAVVLLTLAVPALPGAPVCSCAHDMAGLVVSVVSIEFAMLAETPSATAQPSAGWSAGCVITCERRVPHLHVQCAVGSPITRSQGCEHPVHVQPVSSVPPSARTAPQHEDRAAWWTATTPESGPASSPCSQS
jgi:hypothetical protein